jgi:membrane fusion protein (multidrug efflux system)
MRTGFIRVGYLMGLLSLLTWMGNNIAGGWVYSRAEGIVVGDFGYVSPEYTVVVLDVLVKNGQKVDKGEVVARVSSSRVSELVARLSAESSRQIAQMAQIQAKASMIDMLVSAAETRQQVVEGNVEGLDEAKRKRLLPILTQNAVADQLFKGKQELAVLRAERDTMKQQVAQIVSASRFTDQAIADINALFDAGRMRSPMAGFIAGIEVGPGSVVNPGQLVAELVGERRYVLAYYPVDRLYDLEVGKPITIDAGIGQRLQGKISDLTPIAARLPKEFAKTLAPQERQQLVRIDFDAVQKGRPLPYFTKVVVR